MTVFTRTCEWCGQTFTKTGRPSAPPRFCDRSCSAKWRMSDPEFVASLDTPKRRTAASENLRRWRESPEGQERLAAHLSGPGNPLLDPEVRARSHATSAAKGWPTLTGGNGQVTEPQRMLAEALGWVVEFSIPTGHAPPYPKAYKVDLAEPSLQIAIEVDGQSHRSAKVKATDARQDALLTGMGWTVLRFWNREVTEDLASVLGRVQAVVSSTSRRGPATT